MNILFCGNFSVDYSSESHHAKSLKELGHEVVKLQEGGDRQDVIETLMATPFDMFVWVHTHGWQTDGMDELVAHFKENKIPIVTYHLDLWFGLKRQSDLDNDPFYKQIDYFFCTDKLMADWLNKNTEVKGHYLPAGVYGEECYISQLMMKPKDVLFVGSRNYHPEWPYRPKLVDWLKATYGDRFTHVGGDGQTGTVRGDALNNLYANAKVVVGDSLCLNYDYPYYWSDRVYETMGRGGFLIMPYIKGLDEQFEDGKHLVFYEYNDFDNLKYLIDYYLTHTQQRELIRNNGHELVKSRDTYKHRWAHILKEVFG